MDDKQLKLEALNNAVRHRLASESPDDIVNAAQKYYEFLKGTSEKSP